MNWHRTQSSKITIVQMNVGKHPKLIEQVWGQALKAPTRPRARPPAPYMERIPRGGVTWLPISMNEAWTPFSKFLYAGVGRVSHGPKSWQTQWTTDALSFISYFCIYLLTTYLLGFSQKNVSSLQTEIFFISIFSLRVHASIYNYCMINE